MWLGLTADRIRGVQSDMEAWGDLTAEPRGVDYVETGAAGRPEAANGPLRAYRRR